LNWLGEKADRSLREISKQDLLDYRSILASNLSTRTANHHLVCVRMLFESAVRDGALDASPGRHVGSIRERGAKPQRRPFTVEEIQAILSVASNEWQSLIIFGALTGLRLGDCALLSWDALDMVQGVLRVTTRKTRNVLSIPLSPQHQTHIASLPTPSRPDAPLHPSAYASVRQTGNVTCLSGQFAKLLRAAGLRNKPLSPRGGLTRTTYALSFHSLRHFTATTLAAAGVNPIVSQQLLGHGSIEMHSRYVGPDHNTLAAAAAALPEIV
jgi:integrase